MFDVVFMRLIYFQIIRAEWWQTVWTFCRRPKNTKGRDAEDMTHVTWYIKSTLRYSYYTMHYRT